MKIQVRVDLEGEIAEKFEALKKKTGITANAELVRFLISTIYSEIIEGQPIRKNSYTDYATQDLTGKAKIYIDKDGAGRLYISKKIIDILGFEHGEELNVRVENDILIISKAEKKEPSIIVFRLTDEDLRNLSDLQTLQKELDKLKKDVAELKALLVGGGCDGA